MGEPQIGKYYRITLEGHVSSTNTRRLTEVKSDTGSLHFIETGAEDVTWELVEDHVPNWPPQVGDVWEANGVEYYARRHASHDSAVLQPFNGIGSYYRIHLPSDRVEFKALKPTLKYRR